jgi:uncharacterized protein YgiB involved in biofilm formation
MKRSHRASLVCMGAAPFFMLACEKHEPALVYRTVEECERDGLLRRDECERQFEWANQEGDRTAPRYATRSDCETDFDGGRCAYYGTHYSPRISGMVTRASGTPGRDLVPSRSPHPLFESSDDPGVLRNASNEPITNRSGLLDVPRSAFERPPTSRVISRGGFGQGSHFTFGG